MNNKGLRSLSIYCWLGISLVFTWLPWEATMAVWNDPYPEDQRFNTSVGFGKRFSIRAYQLGLALTEPGYYRAFAMVISIPGTGASDGWDYSFGEELPPSLAISGIPTGATGTAFVFEFEVPSDSKPPTLMYSAGRGGKGLTPGNHLSLSGIWAKLVE